ncbi:MAG: type III secretion system export apparatus subunit SctR [Parachlamydiaceae bacterium]
MTEAFYFFSTFLRKIEYKFLCVVLVFLLVLGCVPDLLHSVTEESSAMPTLIAQGSSQSTSQTTRSGTTPKPPARSSPSSNSTQKVKPINGSSSQSKSSPESEIGSLKRPSLITQAVLLSLLSLMPFIIMILTSFLKIVVVLSLLRSALGVQQAPPNQVINGVAFLLSLFIMYPTGIQMYEAVQKTVNLQQIPDSLTSPDSSSYVIEAANAAVGPLKDFLKRNSSGKHQALFYRLAYRGLPEEYRESLKPEDLIILVPSYITGQLKDAFEIGVLIYIPFFVIDLVTSNILLAMGMMMLSPVTISMPLKLFLLVMLDGWTILIEGLVKTFQ